MSVYAITSEGSVELSGGTWRTSVFYGSVAAAGIHFGATHAHFAEYAPAGVFMLTSGLLQLAWALWVWRGAPRHVLRLGAAANMGIVCLWVVSRTTGLPFAAEPWMRETIHGTDALCSLLEVLVVVSTLALIIGRPRPRVPFRALSLVGMIATMAVSGEAPSHERLVAAGTIAIALALRALLDAPTKDEHAS